MRDRFKQTLSKVVLGHRRSPFMQAMARAARSFTKMYENLNYDIDSNGELWLLERLGSLDPKCLFDVGANVGDWSAMALKSAPRCQVHAFEIFPSTADRLAERFRDVGSVAVNAVGLLDAPGSVRLKHYPSNSTLTGVLDYPHEEPHHWLDVTATTGDTYCREHAITSIDLLKVDAEGADHLVLAGFDKMFTTGAISVVQFEYGYASITSHFLLADFYRFFEERGFVLGKLFPDHVDFREYDLYKDENFLGPNFVAVSKKRSDVIALLS